MKNNNLFIFKLSLLIIKFFSIYNYTINCNSLGKCTLSTSNNLDKDLIIKPGIMPLYLDKEKLIKKWDNSIISLNISSQIDKKSYYGILKGKNGYECTGGLNECINSCCLDGFCVEILKYCESKIKIIEIIYVLTSFFTIILIFLYWIAYFIIGCKYNNKFKNNEDKEFQGYDKIIFTDLYGFYKTKKNNKFNESNELSDNSRVIKKSLSFNKTCLNETETDIDLIFYKKKRSKSLNL